MTPDELFNQFEAGFPGRKFTAGLLVALIDFLVEPVLRKGLTRRVFRYMADGSLEWAAYDDWRSQHERARFFGFASRELPASMTS